jgi:prephenate dehydrogenase
MGIKMGIVGTGVFAQSFIHLFKLHPLVDEVILCDLDEKKLQENGSLGILKINEKEIQIIIGPAADPIVTYIKMLL